jgi:hypothetical protein
VQVPVPTLQCQQQLVKHPVTACLVLFACSVVSVVYLPLSACSCGPTTLCCRTHEEFAAGHPEGAVNVPLLFRSDAGVQKGATVQLTICHRIWVQLQSTRWHLKAIDYPRHTSQRSIDNSHSSTSHLFVVPDVLTDSSVLGFRLLPLSCRHLP